MFAALTLDTGGDTVKVILIAAVVGAVASLISELLLARGKAANTGAFELPGKLGTRLYDLGSIAAIPLGVLAAVIVGLALTPVEETTKEGVTTETMELGNLIVASAIAGLSAHGFLKVLQDRFVAAMKSKGLEEALRNAITGLKDLEANPPADGGAAADPRRSGAPDAGGGGEAVARASQVRTAAEDALNRLTVDPR